MSLLAKINMPLVGPFDEVIKKIKTSDGLIQSHYHVEGSMEEKLRNANASFWAWQQEKRNSGDYSDLYWSCILGVFDDHLILYSSDCYYSIPCSFSGDRCVIDQEAEPTKIAVSVVAKELADSGEVTQMNEDKPTDNLEQDGEHRVDNTTKAGAASKSDANPSVNDSLRTEAQTDGSAVTDPLEDAEDHESAEFSDENGASKPAHDNSTQEAVKVELAKTEAGTKQSAEDKPVNLTQTIDGNVRGADGTPLAFIQSVVQSEDGKSLFIQGIATRADIINSAGQVYPLNVWEKNLESMNKQASEGKFLGKLEHPDSETGLTDTALKFEKFWLQGSDVHFEARVLQTKSGTDLRAMIEGGVSVDLSTRGYGSVKSDKWRGQSVQIVQDDFVCTGIDAVHHGASTGSNVTGAYYQSKTTMETENTNTQTQAQTEATPAPEQKQSAQEWADQLAQNSIFDSAKKELIQQAKETLTEPGLKAYQNALDAVPRGETAALRSTSENMLPVLQATFAKAEEAADESFTGPAGYFVKQSKEELAPKTGPEMIDRLVSDLPTCEDGRNPNHFNSPREQCRMIMTNIWKQNTQTFSGQASMNILLALEQGDKARAAALSQNLIPGATIADGNVDPGGAPFSTAYIFPLVRRVFPSYIMNEIASIQPMDRPSGKIFYLDHRRTEVDALTGNPDPGERQRIDLNTSSNPFTTSYSDNNVEGAQTRQIDMQLASIPVEAYTKKLGATWSIEEMQDLQAYHGLDASQELLSGVARQMAIEWNLTVLNEMADAATGSNLTYGGTAPSGWTQLEWDSYLWPYILKLNNQIFSKRQGGMTHIVCGIDAAMALQKSERVTFQTEGDSGLMREAYPGTEYVGTAVTAGSRFRVLMTNFWATGTVRGSTIMGLRKGSDWSDTPYVWAPYADYVAPQLTDPDTMTQRQGIMSRAAHTAVVADAIATLQVEPSTTGVPL